MNSLLRKLLFRLAVVDSSVVDEKTEASTTATNSETSSETEEGEAAADETKEEASKADETSSKEQEPISAFAGCIL